MRAVTRRYLIGFAAWLPFFLLWTGVALSSGMASVREALTGSFVSMGSAGVLAVPVWLACERWPWPSGFRLRFYALQLLLALFYALAWTIALFALDYLFIGNSTLWSGAAWGRSLKMGSRNHFTNERNGPETNAT